MTLIDASASHFRAASYPLLFLIIGIVLSSPAAAQTAGDACSSNGAIAAPTAAGTTVQCVSGVWTTRSWIPTGTSDIYFTGGNVGIGTTSPSASLHIYESVPTGVIVERSVLLSSEIEYKNTGGSMFAGLATNLNFGIGAQADLNLAFLSVTPAGNVGIGTTTPVVDGNGATYLSVNNATAHAWSEISVGGKGTGTSDNLGTINFYNSSLGTAEKRNAAIVGVNNGATNTGRMDFYATSAGSFSPPAMSVTSSNVGIGTTAPGSKLDVSGNINTSGCVTYNSGTLGTCASDERVKKNILPFHFGLRQIASLEPVTYEYNGLGGTVADGVVRTGLIAQQVDQNAPELVVRKQEKMHPSDAAPTSLLEVKYGDLVFALINAVKELKADIDGLRASLNGGSIDAMAETGHRTTAQEGLAAIMKLKAIPFEWRDAATGASGKEIGFIEGNGNDHYMRLGMSDAATSVTVKTKDGERKIRKGERIVYDAMTAPLVKVVQELKADNDDLRTLVEEEHKEIKTLNLTVAKLETGR
jgi:hypothetical protein